MNLTHRARDRLWSVALPLAAAPFALHAATWTLPGEPARPSTHTVEIRGYAYHPSALQISPGDTVVWINRDAVRHTATAKNGSWNSGTIEPAGSWRGVFSEQDRKTYACTFHPRMKATLEIR